MFFQNKALFLYAQSPITMEKEILIPDNNFSMEYIEGEMTYYGTDTLVMKCISGRAKIFIGSAECNISADMNFVLADSVLMKIADVSKDLKIQTFRFSNHFFNIIYPMLSGEVTDTLMHTRPDYYDEVTQQMLNLLFNQLCLLHEQQENPFRYKMTINTLINYILAVYVCSYDYVKDNIANYSNDRKTNTLCKFYEMCNNDAINNRNVEYYANRLNITSRYLFRICKENSGLSPKQAIDFVIIGKAKTMLLTTIMTTQQIALELNFSDQSAFAQYFKRYTGMVPTDFRKRYK